MMFNLSKQNDFGTSRFKAKTNYIYNSEKGGSVVQRFKEVA